MKNKIILVGLLALLLVGCVSAVVIYSNPTYSHGDKMINKKANPQPIKEQVSKEEWNQIFSDYRSGLLSKEQASSRIREVEIKW